MVSCGWHQVARACDEGGLESFRYMHYGISDFDELIHSFTCCTSATPWRRKVAKLRAVRAVVVHLVGSGVLHQV
jgi:hypothetical protein